MNGLRPGAILRLLVLALGTLVLLPVQLVLVQLGPRHGWRLPPIYHRFVCLCLGVRRTVRGTPPPKGRGGLIVANHVSWLDISVIAAERPVSFVAKSEVANWPVIGLLAKLQRSVFIDRMRRSATAEATAEIGERLAEGQSIVLFAEGTTGDGTRILPLRSSLLGAVGEAIGRNGNEDADVTVYPLTITYTGYHGMVGGRFERAALAWYGDTELAPHLRAMFDAGAIDAELAWGEPIRMGRKTSRKEATRLAEAAIRRARNEAVTGRSLS